jgi:signal transduction histidine kinase
LLRERSIFCIAMIPARMRLAQSVLRPANKASFQLTPSRVSPKEFIFPSGCFNIESRVKPIRSKPARMAVLAVAYFAVGKTSLLLAHLHASASPVWPATGVALAALLLWEIGLWPAIFVGAFLVNVTLWQDASAGTRILQAAGIAVGNTLEAVAGAWLVSRFAHGRKAFLRANDVFRFVFFAGMVSTAISATIGTGTLTAAGLLGKQIYGTAWVTWWLGDMVGAVLFAPLILIWAVDRRVQFGLNRAVEALVLLIAVLIVSALNFSDMFQMGGSHYPLAFLFFPLLAWAAVRFEARGTVAFISVIACLAINGTLHGLGTFVVPSPNTSLLMLQMFICVATFSGLVLAAAVTERKTAEDEVRKFNLELERRVQDRTAQLEGINKELEAFCYSVSHDLRAPLRTIRGFSEVLMELYRPQLDARGQDYLRRTCDAGLQMDKLIEDLLKLSRVTRTDFQRTDVNLSAIVRDIASELAKSEPARSVEFSISPNLSAKGDERLLRVVIDNLLRNAWKFTRKQPKARIEFGQTNGDGAAFFVRDNGVGFDMQYANKLFGVFQRFHSVTEFAGSGVGLAIVQRIINRHGGRVWADAKVNSGATFYFTLPLGSGISN